MDRSTPLKLLSVTYAIDDIGQRVPTTTSKDVYCNLRSVSRQEWKDAGELGFKPAYQVTMFAYDYAGETIAELNGKRYGIYRTYLTTNDQIELYLEEKAGVQTPTTTTSTASVGSV